MKGEGRGERVLRLLVRAKEPLPLGVLEASLVG